MNTLALNAQSPQPTATAESNNVARRLKATAARPATRQAAAIARPLILS